MCHGQMIDTAIRKARNPSWCDCCGRAIAVGERREVQTSVSPDGWAHWEGCRRCAPALDLLYAESGPDACDFDQRNAIIEGARERGWRETRRKLRALRDRLFGAR